MGNHDFVILADGDASFIDLGNMTNPERCFTLPGTSITQDLDVYYQQTTHQDKDTKETVIDYYGKTMTVDPGTKIGIVSKDKAENGVTIDGSLTTLKNAATNYGLAAPFTTFWAYNEAGAAVSVKLDTAQENQPAPVLDPNKPVYVLISATDTTGYPAADSDVTLQAATVDADGTIRFNLKTGATGAAIALAQPDAISGALNLSTTVTEIQEGSASYTIPYRVTFDLNNTGIAADAIQSATVTFYSTNGAWNTHTMELSKDTLSGTWNAVLSSDDFQVGQTITTSAKIQITTATDNRVFYSDSVDTKMTSATTPDPDPDPDPGDGGSVTPSEHTLRYETNGGKLIEEETHKTTWTMAYEDLPVPVRAGYVFEGWYRNSALTMPVTGDVKVYGTVTLYAKWSEDNGLTPDDTGVSRWLNTEEHFAYLQGMPDNSFGPGQNITRAEVAQMFYNLLLNKNVPTTVSFTDVAADAWYADAVNALASMGILNGVGGGKFDPTRNITRAEFTAIAMRFADLDTDSINPFSDINANDWFYAEVVGSVQYGWIKGFTDGTFRPYLSITRAEVTVIVNRMLGRSADQAYVDKHSDELRQFADVGTDNWAYYDIAEATNSHDYAKSGSGERWSDLW